ncbi:hypothetical protein M5T12_10495 [Enterobacter asburiae]|uniref:hypothetical protein n=1 Tax=Enterobacter asburiae TaxID=61645 RepID=UPI0021768092|nr:hypothetical protein [Enterobacter asburiae]UWA77090.1 hypothetical protein M5T12_10495 [Enterobacter asburiae]
MLKQSGDEKGIDGLGEGMGMSVKRYYWDRKSDCDCEIVEQPDGAMVDYDEHASVVAVLEARCAALAAENAGLSAVLMSVIDPSNEPAYQSLGMGCGVEDNSLQTDGYGACEYGWREAMERVYSEVIPEELPETPATDAFLAEVRAQGVDSAINTVIAMMNHQHPVTSKAIDILRVHAYQIRKGVQS